MSDDNNAPRPSNPFREQVPGFGYSRKDGQDFLVFEDANGRRDLFLIDRKDMPFWEKLTGMASGVERDRVDGSLWFRVLFASEPG